MLTPTQQSIQYQAGNKLIDLGYAVALSGKLQKPANKLKIQQASNIFYWLQALDYSDVLSVQTRTQIWTCLAEIAGISDFPVAPVLGQTEAPSVIIGGSTTIINNFTYNTGTPFQNPDVDGTETVDTFLASDARGAVWFYTVRNANNDQRSGILEASWLLDGSEIVQQHTSTVDIGDTSPVTLLVDFNAGNVRLVAVATTPNWIVEGNRYLIYGAASTSPGGGSGGGGSGSNDNIYNIDGALNGNRVLDGVGFNLNFQDLGEFFVTGTGVFAVETDEDIFITSYNGDIEIASGNGQLDLVADTAVRISSFTAAAIVQGKTEVDLRSNYPGPGSGGVWKLNGVAAATPSTMFFRGDGTWAVPPGAGGANIYNSDGTVTDDRTLDGGGFNLTFDNITAFNFDAVSANYNTSTSLDWTAGSSINLTADTTIDLSAIGTITTETLGDVLLTSINNDITLAAANGVATIGGGSVQIASSGTVIVIDANTDLDLRAATFKLNTLAASSPTTEFFRGDGTWAVPPGTTVPDGSETVKGIFEEPTDAEMTSGAATGGTGAKLAVTPAKLATWYTAKLANFVTRETPSGAINSSNVTYTLAFTPVAFVHVFLDGQLQTEGGGNDYTISGSTITFVTAPLTGQALRVSYIK